MKTLSFGYCPGPQLLPGLQFGLQFILPLLPSIISPRPLLSNVIADDIPPPLSSLSQDLSPKKHRTKTAHKLPQVPEFFMTPIAATFLMTW
jgi:hypothetical protein